MSKAKIFKQLIYFIKDPEQIFTHGYDLLSVYLWIKDNTLLTIIVVTFLILITLLFVFIISKILEFHKN